MNWFSLPIFLHDQNTGTFGVIGVIFNDNSLNNTCQHIADEDIVISQFVISMSGDLHLILLDESLNFVKRLAHDWNYT